MAFLHLADVEKSFGGTHILRDINLDIQQGQFVVFVGPSGCGKSTLLRMIAGLETVSGGTISLDGQVLNDVEPAARGVSMVFQSYALYPHLTTYGNVSFGLRMAHQARRVIEDKVTSAASILQLGTLLTRKPAQLSGGQKQRVAIGRAIVREPRLFLFDEPLSNLDAELRVQMRAELTDLHRRLGTTMIYVTHDQVEAMTLADKMVVMNGGHIQQAGAPLELYDDPDNQFVAGFVGSPKMNFLPGRLVSAGPEGVRIADVAGGAEAVLPLAGLRAAPGPVSLGIRPEHLRLLKDEAAPAGVGFEAQVTLVEELGAESFVHLRTGTGEGVILRAGRDVAAPQTTVRLDAPFRHILLFDADGRRLRGARAQ